MLAPTTSDSATVAIVAPRQTDAGARAATFLGALILALTLVSARRLPLQLAPPGRTRLHRAERPHRGPPLLLA